MILLNLSAATTPALGETGLLQSSLAGSDGDSGHASFDEVLADGAKGSLLLLPPDVELPGESLKAEQEGAELVLADPDVAQPTADQALRPPDGEREFERLDIPSAQTIETAHSAKIVPPPSGAPSERLSAEGYEKTPEAHTHPVEGLRWQAKGGAGDDNTVLPQSFMMRGLEAPVDVGHIPAAEPREVAAKATSVDTERQMMAPWVGMAGANEETSGSVETAPSAKAGGRLEPVVALSEKAMPVAAQFGTVEKSGSQTPVDIQAQRSGPLPEAAKVLSAALGQGELMQAATKSAPQAALDKKAEASFTPARIQNEEPAPAHDDLFAAPRMAKNADQYVTASSGSSSQNMAALGGIAVTPGKTEWVPTRGAEAGRELIDPQTSLQTYNPEHISREGKAPSLQPINAEKAVLIVREALDELVANKRREIELQLHPKELGRLRFVMSPAEGQVMVHVFADRPETLEAMRRHVDILAREFLAEGFAMGQFSFEQNQPGDQERRTLEAGPREPHTELNAALPEQAQYVWQNPNARLDIRL